MNNARRKKINNIIEKGSDIVELLEEIKAAIEEVKDEEQDYLDNIPENLQNSEKYELADNAVQSLESALDWIDNIDIEELNGYLEESIQ